MYQIRISFFTWFNDVLNQIVSQMVWLHLTVLGNGFVALALISIILYYKQEYIKIVCISSVVLSLIIQSLKHIFNFPRPLKVLEADQLFQYGKMLYDFSFPSGHTATAFFGVAVFFMVNQQVKYRLVVLFVGILIGLSRIAVGVHWPLDVIVGAFLAFVIHAMVYKFVQINMLSAKSLMIFWCVIAIGLIAGLFTQSLPQETILMSTLILSFALFFVLKAIYRSVRMYNQERKNQIKKL